MNLERHLDKIPRITHRWPLKKTIERIDAVARQGGLSSAAHFILSERRMTVTPQWDDEQKTREVFSQKPSILAVNHPSGNVEPLIALSAFPPQKNVSLIIKGEIRNVFGSELQNSLIPVYHSRRGESSEERGARQQKNLEGIEESIQKLQSGESIMIAPDGGRGDGKWRNGSVSLIQSALAMDEAYLIMAHVPKTTKDDVKHLVFKKPSSVTVRISEPIPVRALPVAHASISEYSHLLENFYNSWASS